MTFPVALGALIGVAFIFAALRRRRNANANNGPIQLRATRPTGHN